MTALGTPDAAAYLAALETELADLAADEREDLLEEVEASLIEMDDDPVARLGSPTHFAQELRASAGLPPAPEPVPPPAPRRSVRERLARSQAAHLGLAVARELAPIWWAARAYVVVLVAAQLFAAPFTSVNGVPRFGSAEAGAALIAVAVASSVAIGIAGRRRRLPARGARIALELALVACALVVVGSELERRVLSGSPVNDDSAWVPGGLEYDGRPLQNVYAYDADGKLLHDVRLYDEHGRPLPIRPGDRDRTRRVIETRRGTPVFNAFPIRYFAPGTRRVEDADAAPPGLNPPRLSPRSPASP